MKLISNELQSLLQQNTTGTQVNMNVGGGTTGYAYGRGMNMGSVNNIQGNQKYLLTAYLKRRAWAIIITVVVIMLLLTSSIFTDFGFDIGDYILSWFV